MSIWQRLFRPEEGKADLDAEIEAHLAMAAADRRERGAGQEQANAEARREFGNVALVKEVTRGAWGGMWLERLAQDVRYALRQLRRSPGFAASVVGTLALGIGAATAMFTVVDHVLLANLPYAHPARLVKINEGAEMRLLVPYLDIAAWRERARSFEGIAFYGERKDHNYIEGRNATTQVKLTQVSGNLFPVLGVAPQLGPGLKDQPESFARRGETHTVVMNDVAWRSLFGADPVILGKVVRVDDEPYTVVGVMPRGFFFPSAYELPQLWTPIELDPKDQGRTFDAPRYTAVARLKYGVSLATAMAELQTIQKQVARAYTDPDDRKDRSQLSLESYGASLQDKSTTKALLTLTAAAGLLWLIACVNATNLLLARSTVRQREMAMRGALGASRGRLIQQLIVEGLLLSGMAAAFGTALAMGTIVLFSHLPQMARLPIETPATVNLHVLVVLAALTLASAIVSSAWPAFLAARSPIEPALRQGGQQSGVSRSQHRLRGGLVISEIAMSLALLAACGLLLRTLYALRHVPLGFRTDHILVANMAVPTYRFTALNAADEIYEPLLERVQHLPGVDAAGLMTQVPLGHTFTVMLGLADGPGAGITSQFKAVSPDLQRVFGFRMLAGRYFNAGDTAAAEPVVVVNRSFARAFAPKEQDMGKVIGMKLLSLSRDRENPTPTTIVGILDDFHQRAVGEPSQPEIEVSLPQVTRGSRFYDVLETVAMDLAVRTQRSPDEMVSSLGAALRKASPELADSNITTMDQIVEDSYGSQMLAARLLEIFAGSALLLCVAGLYGLLAYVVSQRTREMGVRFALGAQRGDVVWLVMRQAGSLVLTGIAAGTALAFVSDRLVRGYLFGVTAHDGWTLGAVAAVLIVSGALAAYLPARRAAGVNPVEALRAD
ncbi:MAG TPA: ABC transporter permease [Acidobacteriaceae bacterium]|jgi:predicted permease|nr:ABC transporter permease [Acidobacteriaceae bacterium]